MKYVYTSNRNTIQYLYNSEWNTFVRNKASHAHFYIIKNRKMMQSARRLVYTTCNKLLFVATDFIVLHDY